MKTKKAPPQYKPQKNAFLSENQILMEHTQRRQIFDAFNENYIKDYFDVETGGFLVIHIRHGLNEVKANKIIGFDWQNVVSKSFC